QKKGKVISSGAEQSEAEWRNPLKAIPRQARNDFPFGHFERSPKGGVEKSLEGDSSTGSE
ncbi:MAG: hypothetical protein ABIK38_05680, partial [candidate division WOR-3 bacterium]